MRVRGRRFAAPWVSLWVSLWTSLFALGAGSAHALDLAFTGYARDPDSGELLYLESHTVRDHGSPNERRVVLYRCASGGAAFARKTLTYTAVRTDPDFRLEDARTGHLEGLVTSPIGRQVYYRANGSEPVRMRGVLRDAGIVSDAGFDEFVQIHWRELERGDTVRFPFLVPSRLESLDFKVSKDRDELIDGAEASVIRLNLSGFFGLFVPSIEVAYDRKDRVLLRYSGLVNIRDLEGDNLSADISMPRSERRAIRRDDFAEAMAVPLVERCPAA